MAIHRDTRFRFLVPSDALKVIRDVAYGRTRSVNVEEDVVTLLCELVENAAEGAYSLGYTLGKSVCTP